MMYCICSRKSKYTSKDESIENRVEIAKTTFTRKLKVWMKKTLSSTRTKAFRQKT